MLNHIGTDLNKIIIKFIGLKHASLIKFVCKTYSYIRFNDELDKKFQFTLDNYYGNEAIIEWFKKYYDIYNFNIQYIVKKDLLNFFINSKLYNIYFSHDILTNKKKIELIKLLNSIISNKSFRILDYILDNNSGRIYRHYDKLNLKYNYDEETNLFIRKEKYMRTNNNLFYIMKNSMYKCVETIDKKEFTNLRWIFRDNKKSLNYKYINYLYNREFITTYDYIQLTCWKQDANMIKIIKKIKIFDKLRLKNIVSNEIMEQQYTYFNMDYNFVMKLNSYNLIHKKIVFNVLIINNKPKILKSFLNNLSNENFNYIIKYIQNIDTNFISDSKIGKNLELLKYLIKKQILTKNIILKYKEIADKNSTFKNNLLFQAIHWCKKDVILFLNNYIPELFDINLWDIAKLVNNLSIIKFIIENSLLKTHNKSRWILNLTRQNIQNIDYLIGKGYSNFYLGDASLVKSIIFKYKNIRKIYSRKIKNNNKHEPKYHKHTKKAK